jgi:hypothetical protein
MFAAEACAYTMKSCDYSAACSFGIVPIRIYYPAEFTGATHAIHVSRGGSGLGDDREAVPACVNAYVQAGYVVVTIDHRNGGGSVSVRPRDERAS